MVQCAENYMKILFWNIGYARGINGSPFDYIKKIYRLFYLSKKIQKQTLDEILDIVSTEKPDLFTYAEISIGAFNRCNFDQHQYILTKLVKNHYAEAAVSKYGESLLNIMPFHKGNANGVVSFLPGHISEFFLQHSRKKLVLKTRYTNVTIFSVHLPLVSTDRHKQLKALANLVNSTTGDVILCGDFNILNGIDELAILKQMTHLQDINQTPTFPSYNPKKILDVFLYRFENTTTTPKVRILESTASDHRPVIFEW